MSARGGVLGGRGTLLTLLTALVLLMAPSLAVGPAAADVPRPGATALPPSRPVGGTGATIGRGTLPTHVEEGLDVTLRGTSPSIATVGEPVRLDLTVRNTGDTALTDVAVHARLQPTAPLSRGALTEWLRTDLSWRTLDAGSATVPGPLAPGDEAAVTLEVPASALPAPNADSWGPRGLLVQADAPDADAQGALRTWLVLAPPEPVTPLPYTAVVPVVADAEEIAGSLEERTPFDALAARAAPRASELVRTLDPATVPGLTLALDPLLIRPAARPQEDGAAARPEAVEARESAAALLEAVRPAAERGGLVLLPEGDPDAAALAHAERGRTLADAVDASRGTASAASLTARSDVLLAPGTVLDSATLATAEDAGLGRLVGTSALAPAAPAVAWTPAATTRVEGLTPDDVPVDLPAVLADTDLSRAVLGRTPSVGPLVVSTDRLPAAEARQLVLATTAVVQRERPNDRRPLALLLERAAATDPELSAHLRTVLDTLAQAPWLEPSTLDALPSASQAAPSRTDLPAQQPVDTELDAPEQAALAGLVASTERVAVAATNPSALVEPTTQRVRLLTATSWREEPDARDAAAASVREELREVPSRVTVTPSSTINMLATSAELPVRVSNGLDTPLTVRVTLRTPDTRLTAAAPVEVTVPARGDTTAFVPVTAVGSGNVTAQASLATPDGVPLGETVTIAVRLRADWEGRGAAVGGLVLATVLVVGIVRTARRKRRRVDAAGTGA